METRENNDILTVNIDQEQKSLKLVKPPVRANQN